MQKYKKEPTADTSESTVSAPSAAAWISTLHSKQVSIMHTEKNTNHNQIGLVEQVNQH